MTTSLYMKMVMWTTELSMAMEHQHSILLASSVVWYEHEDDGDGKAVAVLMTMSILKAMREMTM
jgi:hypothetical protein